MKELAALLAGLDTSLPLDVAALLLATIEYPDLDIKPSLQILDSHAEELAARLAAGASFVSAANGYLFDELGFTGNTADYYNPANSCLNEALRSRTGIPITLAVVYLEIARRLSAPVFGIGQPGHFLVQYDDGSYSTYIDVFNGGKLLTAKDGYQLERVDKRKIIARMINNLRGIYLSRHAHRKSLRILNLLLEADPYSPEEHKQRGVTHLLMEQTRAAKADFERYLELAPEAPDRAAVEQQVASLTRWLVGMN